MTISPLLSGGAGFDFEDGVAAVYLSGLLLESGVFGLGQYTVSRVALQRASSGAPLDDVIVSGTDAAGESATLHLQVKSTLHVGDGPTNTDFREIVSKAWATVCGGGFKEHRDRVGAAVGSISQARLKAFRRIQAVAFNSATSEDFWDRFDSVTNQEARSIRDAFVTVLKEIDPTRADNERLWLFFRQFVVLHFDIHDADGRDAFHAVERLKSALKPNATEQAASLWRKLIAVAKDVGDAGGSIDRRGLLERITPEFPLQAARSAKMDLQRLSTLARLTLSDIRLDVNGFRVHRTALVEKISETLTRSRFVQITGEPGTGKSAVLRSIAEAEERNGFVFVLSEKRIDGNGWVGFAKANGLTSSDAGVLLSELGASASPILFIDGIDRIVLKPARQVVADILRTIATEPSCAKWRVVASVRDENIEHVRTWIPAEFLNQTGVISLEVGLFDNNEAAQIAKALPPLAPLLSEAGPASEIARRPFFLRVLAEGIARDGSVSTPQSEIELIDAWWSRGGYDAARADARRRQLVLLAAAEKGIPSFGRKIDAVGLDVNAVQDLVDDSVIRDVERGLTIGFTHDVFFEWSLFQLARSRGGGWLDLVKGAGEPPFFGRIVSLLSQRAFEHDESWQVGLEALETASARSQWKRAWLIAPFSSPLFATHQNRFDGAFDQNPERLRRVLLGFQAEKTQPNPLVLGGFAGENLDRLARLRLADRLSWPSDLLAWWRFLAWFLTQCGALPPALVSDTLPVFEAWISAFMKSPEGVPMVMKEAIGDWLKAIEAHRHPGDAREILTPNYQKGWGAISNDELQEVERTLRSQFFLSTRNDPELQQAYFHHLLEMADRIRDGAAFIAEYAPLIHAAASPRAVDVCIEAFLDELPEDEERNRGLFGGGRSIHDWDELSLGEGGADFFPPSPAREPFKTFFQTAPQETLRLIRAISNHAMEAWKQLNALAAGRTPRVLVIKFPWAEQEFWGNMRVYGFYRGIHGPHILDSALMALEEWAFTELENGRSVDDIIFDVVKENKCCAVLGIALEIALHGSRPTNVSLALLATSHLWLWDIARGRADLVNLRQNELGFTIGSKNEGRQHEALKKANGRAVRRQDIQTLAMMFVVGQNAELREAAKSAIVKLPEALPYESEEDTKSAEATAYLAREAKSWAFFADPSYYRLYKTDEPDKIAVGFESPEASNPERIARANEAQESLSWFTLEANVQKILNGEDVATSFSLAEAIAKVRKEDTTALLNSESDDPLVSIKQGAVVGVAAVVAKNYSSAQAQEIEWAKKLLQQGATRPYRLDQRTNPGSILTHYPGCMAARGLLYLILAGIDERWAKETLLRLMLHPLEAVSENAVASCLAGWARDPRFSWIGFCLGLALTNQESGPDDWKNPEATATRHNADREKKLANALAALKEQTSPLADAPAPTIATAEPEDDEEKWRKSRVVRPLFRHDLAARVIRHAPIESIVQLHEAKELLLKLADRLLAWTISANPPERRGGRRMSRPTPPYEWTRLFMTWLAHLCSVLPSDLALPRYIDVILAIDDDDACFELLDSFVDHFVCRQIHDAKKLSSGTLVIMKAVADRVAAADWVWDETRVNGNLTRQKHTILKALFLVNVAQATGARRFANGDWSDIAVVIPALDKLLESITGVTGGLVYFLNLAERSIDHYPADALADTLTGFLVAQQNKPAALRSISGPERMAALVQTLASREQPLSESLRAKLLTLLDMLVELGDRRSAALLGSEWFKTARRI